MRKYSPTGQNRPDQNAIWLEVDNVFPTEHGAYHAAWAFAAPLDPSPPASAGSSPGTNLAAVCMQRIDGTRDYYVGTTTKLWQNVSATWTDRSVGGGYSATDWCFAQFGNYALATNGTDQIQVRDATTANAFANLGGSPPSTAKILVVQSNIVVAFNINSGAHCWASSDVANHAEWAAGEAVTSTPILQRPGPITAAIAFRDEIIVFKKSSIYRMRYVGAPVYWTVDLVADGIGADDKDSVLACGDLLLFGGSFGNYIFDGASFRPVDADTPITNNYKPLVSSRGGVYFPNCKTAIFQDNSGVMQVYNLQSDRWGKFTPYDGSSNSLVSYFIVTGTPEALQFTSGLRQLQIANPGATSGVRTMTGTNTGVAAYVESGYFGNPGDDDIAVTRVTPIIALSSIDVVLGATGPTATGMSLVTQTATNRRFNSATTLSTVTSATDQPRFDLNAAAKFFKFKVSCTAHGSGWEIHDIVVDAGPGGKS